jgi:5-methylcytosine-specific restriction endonuclease McrA
MIKEHQSGFIKTTSLKIAIPEVIALKFYDRIPFNEVKFTRKNIYEHYGYKCCYCGKKFNSKELNLDHITPKSRGGKTDWLNVVTSCIACNLAKGNKLPSEAGMELIIKPSKPAYSSGLSLILHSPVKLKTSWQKFVDNVYWNIELDQSE